MFPIKALLSCLLLVLGTVDASPAPRDFRKATLNFTTKFKAAGFSNIAEHDRARAEAMRQASHLGKRSTTFQVTNAVITYTAQVGIGSPATQYTLSIDTGSANTWVGAHKLYTPTSNSFNTGNSVAVSYGTGNFSGEEWTDTVTLAPGLTIFNQSIGVAAKSAGFENGIDGILGVGPTALTQGTVENTYEVPTVTDNLYSQGIITEEILGVYYVPVSERDNNGQLTFGGYDSSVMTSTVNYVPLTTTSPARNYWGIDQSISYNGTTIMPTTAGIVDTGTTLILLASDAFQKYQAATGATADEATGFLTITAAQYANLMPLTFQMGSYSYVLPPNAQIWPRALNKVIGGNPSSIYLIVGDIGHYFNHTQAFGFINGYTFLERFYSVYDGSHSRVGFAETQYTNAMIN